MRSMRSGGYPFSSGILCFQMDAISEMVSIFVRMRWSPLLKWSPSSEQIDALKYFAEHSETMEHTPLFKLKFSVRFRPLVRKHMTHDT